MFNFIVGHTDGRDCKQQDELSMDQNPGHEYSHLVLSTENHELHLVENNEPIVSESHGFDDNLELAAH